MSPEGWAAILWKEANEQTNTRADEQLALTARRNLDNGLIDDVIPEPVGGAHRDPKATAERVQTWILDRLRELTRINPETLVRQRYEKYRAMGAFSRKIGST